MPHDGASAKVSVVKKIDEEAIDLQAVLTAGNIADKGIVLTNATDDALLLSLKKLHYGWRYWRKYCTQIGVAVIKQAFLKQVLSS